MQQSRELKAQGIEMTRSEAIQIYLSAKRTEQRLREGLPEWRVDRIMYEAAEDSVDVMVAFGLLKLDDETAVKDAE